jgi:multiple sugar transport system ATP-binding protein
VAAIDMKNIVKKYGDGFPAVNDISIDVADGEFMILVGPSGCGKSTLLRMIVGLEDISDGEMRIGDEVVNERAPKDRDLAMVFQNYALYPHLTVRENIAFPLQLAKMPQAEIDKRVEEAAKVLELHENLDRKPANLSGGQRQRVAMGRAIVRDPKAFLFDEPLSNLDAKLRVQMRTEISRIQRKYGTTTVYVTHDQTEAMTLGDRVAVLRKGVIQQVDTPRNLYNDPANLFVAGFIGSPSMNLLPGTLNGTRLELPFGTIELPAARAPEGSSSGRQLIVGIRPEHFEDASLVSEEDRPKGATFTSRIEVIEWMGSELYAYLPYNAGGAMAAKLDELAADLDLEQTSGENAQMVARFDAASRVAEGGEAEVWVDLRRIHLFDPDSGLTLNRHETSGSRDATPGSAGDVGSSRLTKGGGDGSVAV